jgi:hypothetical protein
MSRICYVEKRFAQGTLGVIEQANDIIDEYLADGMKLTLRQLYYQFVSRDMIANIQSEYKRLGGIISDARLAGLIDWTAIEDRTRKLVRYYHNTDPGQAIQDALDQFSLDKWKGQEYRVEVWIEKEALVGVIDRICRRLDVPYFACKGYVSQSEMWKAAQRLENYADQGQKPVIIHLGDHDPSGIDMTRDIETRQDTFSDLYQDYGVVVERIALNMDQVREYNPPPNPTKLTDSRARDYISEYGDSSWELDALEPRVMRTLIEDTVKEYRNEDRYREVLEKEAEYGDIMQRIADDWRTL